MKKLALIGSLCFLVGCQSVGRVGSPLWDLTSSEQEKWETYRSICRQYGISEGTAAFSQCLISTKQNIDNRTSNGWNDFSHTTRCLSYSGC